MKKVICINDKPNSPTVAPWMIKEGEVYEVTFEGHHSRFGPYYELSVQPRVGYWVEYFIPLSSIDETTFERNYNKETV